MEVLRSRFRGSGFGVSLELITNIRCFGNSVPEASMEPEKSPSLHRLLSFSLSPWFFGSYSLNPKS